MDAVTEMKQWELCPFCGKQRIPDPAIVAKIGEEASRHWVYFVCPTKDHGSVEPLPGPFVDGAYYHGKCRNAVVARYFVATDKFVYMREKFGSVFPEEIGYSPQGRFDYFRAYGVLEQPPFEIPDYSKL